MSALQYQYNLPVFLDPIGCSHAPVLYTIDFEHLRCPPIMRDVGICELVVPPPYDGAAYSCIWVSKTFSPY